MNSQTKLVAITLVAVAACARATSTASGGNAAPMQSAAAFRITPPSPDPRVGLRAGTMDPTGTKIVTPAAEAIWNLRAVGHAPPPDSFATTNSDLAFTGNYAIQGNYSGFQVWDLSNPARPALKLADFCPASQSDVSVYNNLLFVSSESNTGRLDCKAGGVPDPVSKERIRGVRIFDITDISHPRYLANVQTCRGSHTHTVVTDPNDKDDVYIYISGTSAVRSAEELPGCVSAADDPNTANFRIEVIKVPLAHPELAAIVSSPRIFAVGNTAGGLVSPGSHGAAPVDTTAAKRAFDAATARRAAEDSAAGRGRGGRAGRGGGGGGLFGGLTLTAASTSADTARAQKTLDSLKTAGVLQRDVSLSRLSLAATLPPAAPAGGRGGRGGAGVFGGLTLAPTATKADTARVQHTLDSLKTAGILQPGVTTATFSFGRGGRGGAGAIPRGTLTQCHDITVYPAVGLAGGACAGMGLLLDIHDAAHPNRLDAVADSNFSYWHSATFSNDGSMVLFSDEWGGGSAAFCRATDPKNWGADAIFRIVDGKMKFQSYYKLPAAQTPAENCVAHNGSLIPIPGRTVMVQAWYQGGISVFDWSNPQHPTEIAFFDRGPYAPTFVDGGFWSAYWYNGYIVGSEIRRGLDVFELTPSPAISQNEIDAAKTVHFTQLNVQDQPKFVWPTTFSLARAYVDQLARENGLPASQIASTRSALDAGERGASDGLQALSLQLEREAGSSSDAPRVHTLAGVVGDLAKMKRTK